MSDSNETLPRLSHLLQSCDWPGECSSSSSSSSSVTGVVPPTGFRKGEAIKASTYGRRSGSITKQLNKKARSSADIL
jgi:hypothetical protein